MRHAELKLWFPYQAPTSNRPGRICLASALDYQIFSYSAMEMIQLKQSFGFFCLSFAFTWWASWHLLLPDILNNVSWPVKSSCTSSFPKCFSKCIKEYFPALVHKYLLIRRFSCLWHHQLIHSCQAKLANFWCQHRPPSSEYEFSWFELFWSDGLLFWVSDIWLQYLASMTYLGSISWLFIYFSRLWAGPTSL